MGGERQLGLAPAPAGSGKPALGALLKLPDGTIEFRWQGEPWRIEHFKWLEMEFEIQEEDLLGFLEFAYLRPRTQTVVNRMFGIKPVIPGMNADPDDLRTWTRMELAERMGMSSSQLQQELDALRAGWKKRRDDGGTGRQDHGTTGPRDNGTTGPQDNGTTGPRDDGMRKEERKHAESAAKAEGGRRKAEDGRQRGKPKAEIQQEASENAKGMAAEMLRARNTPEVVAAVQGARGAGLSGEDLELLREHRFTASMFEMDGRSREDNETEAKWFVERIRQWQRILDEPSASSLARQLLLKELDVERIQSDLIRMRPSDTRYAKLQTLRKEREEAYANDWLKLNEIFPMAAAITTRAKVLGVISDFVVGVRDFISQGDNTVKDGLFDAMEIEVLMRVSEQCPTPAYRAGLVAAINMARAGMWDPNYKQALPNGTFRKMDEGWREAFERVRSDLAEPLVNLESNDPKDGEYPKLGGMKADG